MNQEHPERAALSLDDAAALFMQLEVTDGEDLARVRDALQQVVNDTVAYTHEARTLAAEAAKKLTLLLQGKTRAPQTLLTEAGWLIEGALEAGEARPAERSTAARVEDKTSGQGPAASTEPGATPPATAVAVDNVVAG